jgi:hypothetical protein
MGGNTEEGTAIGDRNQDDRRHEDGLAIIERF